jgi:hypothetical protein
MRKKKVAPLGGVLLCSLLIATCSLIKGVMVFMRRLLQWMGVWRREQEYMDDEEFEALFEDDGTGEGEISRPMSPPPPPPRGAERERRMRMATVDVGNWLKEG